MKELRKTTLLSDSAGPATNYYPLTFFENELGLTDSSKVVKNSVLEQGKAVFLGNKDVLHKKVSVTAIPKVSIVGYEYQAMSMHGPIVSHQYVPEDDFYYYAEALLDARTLHIASLVDYGRMVSHFVVEQGPGYIATYSMGLYHGYGSYRPSWRIVFYEQQESKLRFSMYKLPWTMDAKEVENENTLASFSSISKQQSVLVEKARSDFLKSAKFQNFSGVFRYEDRTVTIPNYLPLALPPHNVDYGELCVDAISGIEFFTGNGKALVKDVLNLNSAFQRTIQDVKGMAKGKAKAFASAYLSVHYGYKLLASDIKDVVAEMKRYLRMNPYTKVHSSSTVTTEQGTFTDSLSIYYEMFGKCLSDLSKLSYLIDTTPSLHSIWDSIPFSFVVDWFANIGDVAQTLDDWYTISQRHDVQGSILSCKWQHSFKEETADAYLMIKQSIYRRSCTEHWMPLPTPTIDVGVASFSHVGEVTALVVANKD